MKTLAVALISAGVATLVTAKVVEKVLTADIDLQIQEEVAASVAFIEAQQKPAHQDVNHPVPDAPQRPEVLDDVTEVSREDGKARVRYDKIVKEQAYAAGPHGDDTSDTELEEALVQAGAAPDIYVISLDEYMENETGYLQSTLTYCGDGVVLDELNEHVPDQDELIGRAVPPFGELSNEPHVVYVRNAKLRREFEIVHDPDIAGADILADPESSLS